MRHYKLRTDKLERENNMTWYPRENYLQKIRDFYHETDIIKVSTGVRRYV